MILVLKPLVKAQFLLRMAKGIRLKLHADRSDLISQLQTAFGHIQMQLCYVRSQRGRF